jgi:DNA polymerase-4
MRTRVILHADLDAFYASVEELDDPSLRGKPVIVGGGPDERGVVSAANYAARRFGVHSALPLRTAGRLCPQGVFLPGRPERYRELSRQVMAIFASLTPLVEPISLDEAFLDVTNSTLAFGDGQAMAQRIKDRVRDEVGLIVSVGVATNKLCAKVASDLRKPDALVVVPPGGEAAFLAPLPVGRLWGVGPQARAVLADYGVTTIGQLRPRPNRRSAAVSGSTARTWRPGHEASILRPCSRRRRPSRSGTSTPSSTTPSTVRVSTQRCSTWPNRWPAGCAGTISPPAPCSSSCATRASRR